MQTQNPLPEFQFDEFDLVLDEKPIETTPEQITTATPESTPVIEGNETPETPAYAEDADQAAIAAYETLKEKGIWVEDPDTPFTGKWDDVNKFFEDLPQRVLNTVVSQAPDVMKQVLRFTFSDPNITWKEVDEFMKVHREEQEQPAPEIETMDAARSYLEDLYKARGIRPTVIQATLNTLEDDDALLEEAKAEIEKDKAAKQTSKSEQMIAEKENARLQQEQATLAFVKKLDDEIKSLGWKDSRISKVKENLRGNTLATVVNEIVKSPKALIKLADFVAYFDRTNGDIDYSNFMKNSETAPTKTFQARVEQTVNTNSATVNTRSNLPNQTQLDTKDWVPVIEPV